MKERFAILCCLLALAASCTTTHETRAPNSSNTAGVSGPAVGVGNENADAFAADASRHDPAAGQPRTVRDFFMLLPEKYFVLEGCDRATDKDCRQAKLDYLKTFAEVEDTANGYLKGGCDGAQACMEMALFKRPDGTYLVGLATSAEMMNEYYFLDYKNGAWTDVSAQAVPKYSRSNVYELPRYGTTMKVFAKKIVEKGDDYEISDKGAHLYNLVWKDGKFLSKPPA